MGPLGRSILLRYSTHPLTSISKLKFHRSTFSNLALLCGRTSDPPPKWKIILESTLFQFGFQTIFYIILYVPIWFDALPQGKPRDFCFFLRGCLFSLEKTIGTLMTIIQAKGEAGLEIFRHCRWPCQGEGKEGEILRIWGQAKGILYLVWSNLVGVTTFRTARLVLEASCFSCLFLRNIMNDLGMVLDLWKNDHFSWAIVWAFFTALCDIQDGLRKSPLRKGRWSIYIYICIKIAIWQSSNLCSNHQNFTPKIPTRRNGHLELGRLVDYLVFGTTGSFQRYHKFMNHWMCSNTILRSQ